MRDLIGVIDTHFHLWDLTRWKYAWPTAAEGEIFTNFALADYDGERAQSTVKYGVFVEAHDSVEETRWAIKAFHGRECAIKGIVGYASIGCAENLDKELSEFTQEGKFVGVRNIPNFQQEGWLRSPGVMEGMKVLQKYGLTYDLLIKKENFKDALEVVRRNHGVKFVIDHLAKPDAKTGETEDWYNGMSALAEYDNVHCKLSGMVTEADLKNWKLEDFKRHVDHVVRQFGTDRVMFGSDWPVCKMANASINGVCNLLNGLLDDITAEEKKKVFWTNAKNFYNLKI